MAALPLNRSHVKVINGISRSVVGTHVSVGEADTTMETEQGASSSAMGTSESTVPPHRSDAAVSYSFIYLVLRNLACNQISFCSQCSDAGLLLKCQSCAAGICYYQLKGETGCVYFSSVADPKRFTCRRCSVFGKNHSQVCGPILIRIQ